MNEQTTKPKIYYSIDMSIPADSLRLYATNAGI